ncbi:MAG: hypothetical protein QN178_18135 [Armatimonadota bacterium]|nr:hypothetical protein [Armatimonadota bacterium]
MLNHAVGNALDQVRARKGLATLLLDACIATWNSRGTAALEEVNIIDDDGRQWRWLQAAFPECRLCGRTSILYRAQGHEEEWADFCLECWEIDILDGSGRVVAHATRRFEKWLRSLPPGARITSITMCGETTVFDPPIDPLKGGPY